MASIHIQRNHNLGREEAREAVEDIAQKLKSQLQVEYGWNGDTLNFERPGAKGEIAVTDSTVTVDIELGMMLSAFKGMVEQQVNNYLNQRLGPA